VSLRSTRLEQVDGVGTEVRNRGRLGVVAGVVATLILSTVGAAIGSPGGSSGATDNGSSNNAGNNSTSVTSQAAKPAKKKKFTPASGPTFNNPYGGKTATRAIIRKLLRTIDSVPRGGNIRIASWNVRSNNITQALLRAHRRKVSVRVIMDYSNFKPGNPNIDARHLRQGLRKGNKKRKPARKSWLRECKGACRGPHGIAHTKFYLFSQAGKAKKVVIYGSNNATELAATIQWNDIFTQVGNKQMYSDFNSVFKEMSKDKKPKGGGYREFDYPRMTTIFYPNAGKDAPTADPDLKRLNQIRCNGTTGGVGTNGHTKIRIAQTAMHGDRGIRLAQRLATMQRRGCDIKVVYAMFGNRVVQILRQAGIGLTHLAWDRNDDGIYDRYLHMKTMAVAGRIGKDTEAFLTVNGSANWTQVAQVSDEVVGVLPRSGITRKYIRWIDFLFHHRPASWGADTGTSTGGGAEGVLRTARRNGVDPYALIKKDL
jgi:hypothetical protein